MAGLPGRQALPSRQQVRAAHGLAVVCRAGDSGPAAEEGAWVFQPRQGNSDHLSEITGFWRDVRMEAGLRDVRLHDLRHSHTAVAVNSGEGLCVVAGLLGHADIATTFGYAYLAAGAVFDADNRVSRGLADMLDGREVGR